MTIYQKFNIFPQRLTLLLFLIVSMLLPSLANTSEVIQSSNIFQPENHEMTLDSLKYADTLSFEILQECAYDFITLDKDDEAITFYEYRSKKFPTEAKIIWLAFAIAYYKTCTAFNSHQNFARFLCDVTDYQYLPDSIATKLHCEEEYAHALYELAWEAFINGQETKGQELLFAAYARGNDYAKEDYFNLIKCSTLDCYNPKYKQHEIRQWNKLMTYFRKYNFQPADNSNFWHIIANRCTEWQNLMALINKKKRPKTVILAINRYNAITSNTFSELEKLKPFFEGLLEKFLKKELVGSDKEIIEIRIFQSEEYNAFATPLGHIYIHSALCERLQYRYRLLLAICAHEAAHIFCRHHFTQIWAQEVKEKRNLTWSIILASTYAAGMTTAAIASGTTTNNSYNQNVGNVTNDIFQLYSRNAYFFQFKYSRMQEIEADIVAYRFCEQSGIGGYAYIMALQMIESGRHYDQKHKDKTSDHPDMKFRIGMLKHIYHKEHSNKIQEIL